MQIEERFNLKEGPVHITMPTELSLESYQDLAERIILFLRVRERCVPTAGPWATCKDCGLPYSDDGWADFVAPHDVWAKLIEEDGASLLCANCMVRRASRLGIECPEARFTSGPFAAIRID